MPHANARVAARPVVRAITRNTFIVADESMFELVRCGRFGESRPEYCNPEDETRVFYKWGEY